MIGGVLDLFKQTGRIHLVGDGVDADLPLGPAIVLFGPNDAGKTNLLRQLRGLLRSRAPEARDSIHRLKDPPDLAGSMLPGEGWSAVWILIDLDRADHLEFLLEVAGSGEKQDGESVTTFLLPFEFMEEDRLDYSLRLGDSFTDRMAETLSESEHAESADEPPTTADFFLLFLTSVLRERTRTLNGSEVALPELDATAWLELGREQTALHLSWRLTEGLKVPEYVWFLGTAAFVSAAQVIEIDEASVATVARQFERYVASLPAQQDKHIRALAESLALDDEQSWLTAYHDGSLDAAWLVQFRDRWFDSTGRIDDVVVDAAAAISRKANDLAPSFLAREYAIEVQPLSPVWWEAAGGNRLRIALVPRSSGDEMPAFRPDDPPRGYEVAAVGAGLQPWALFAIHEALRLAGTDPDAPLIYFFDEPERHLHPLAQREAAEFITRIAREGGNVVVATHSPTFLGTRMPNGEYVRVRREYGVTRADVIDPQVLAAVDSYAISLGLSPADLLQLTRAALLVEGRQDRIVIEGLFGRELAERFVRILPLEGSDNSLAVLDAELLRQISVPLFLILDGTSQQQLDALRAGRLRREDFAYAGKEVRKVATLTVALKGSDLTLTPIPFPLPDVIWAFPEEAMRLASEHFTSWDAITAAFRRVREPMNPKTFLGELLQRRVDTNFVREVVAVCQERALPPRPALTAAITSVLTAVDNDLT
jgi:energy-coupling factor transporter ATP-binding protein EcfA2